MTKGHPFSALRRPATVAALLASSLVLAACGGDDEPAAQTEAEAEDQDLERAGQSGTLTGVSPLTGGEIGDDAPAHPVLVVKIDNTGAAPQSGLGSADLVVEELVEGGSTRLAAFFWEQTPNLVGPVRSVRGTDIGIVLPASAVLIASGGTPGTVRQLERSEITLVREGAEGFSRDDTRSAPYNLVMDLEKLATTLDPSSPTASYLPFGDAADLPRGEEATSMDVEFSAAQTTSWRYEDGTGYVRPDSFAEQGDDFVPQSVLVVDVQVRDAGYRDAAGSRVPESEFFGTGDAVLFHEGRAIRATWSKDGPAAALELQTPDGEPLTLPAGKTFIELVPRSGGSVAYAG